MRVCKMQKYSKRLYHLKPKNIEIMFLLSRWIILYYHVDYIIFRGLWIVILYYHMDTILVGFCRLYGT